MKSLITNTTQIGLVVNDLDKTMDAYVQKYGIGPWSVYTFSSANVKDLHIGGKPAEYSMKLALCNVGNTQWELIQPLSDNSDYVRFLKEHGEGIHHLAVAVEDVEKYLKFCDDLGLYPIQGGVWQCGGNTKFLYDYRDTRDDLKVILELHAPDADLEMPQPDYIVPEGPMPRSPIFTDVRQACIVCKDLDSTIKTYTDKYGIGPWKRYHFDNKTVGNMKADGKHMDFAIDVGLTKIGNIEWKLIQPLDDKSVYAGFLTEHGEGVHHVTLDFDYGNQQQDMKCIVEVYGS
jgi:catechol 2,3-dioxygenase-like lactoylglutathione lyase family enzyme